jgi:predicted permease
MSPAWFRLRALWRRLQNAGARDEEIEEELRAFVELDADSHIRSGMTPDEARRAALIDLGGIEQVKEQVRDAQVGARLEGVVRDFRYALRSLRRSPVFSASVLGNLSLGLPATVVAFAFINGTLLRQFPGVRDQGQLVMLEILDTTPVGSRLHPVAMTEYPDVVRALREGITSLDGLASFTESDVALALPQARSVPAAFVSPNYFDVLGMQPQLGRTFLPDERGAVAVIGYDLWTREFARDPSVAGRGIQVGGRVFQITGVAPAGFRGTTQNAVRPGVDIWLPMAFVDRLADPLSVGRGGLVFLDERPGERVMRYVGRMREADGRQRVETELALVARRAVTREGRRAVPVIAQVSGLSRLNDRGDARQMVAIILFVPVLVLVIACVNAGNLFLVRASQRRREIAVRLAIGATRSRLVRQLIIESLVLALGAAILALPLAWSALRMVAVFMLVPMPIDGTVVLVALATALVTVLGFGLIPALQASGHDPSAALGTSTAGAGGTRRESRGRRVLVAAQIALSLGLLATGFQLTSALESRATPPGTDPGHLLLASFNLAQLRMSSTESEAFYGSLLDRISRIPGVTAAGLSSRSLDSSWTGFDPANLVTLNPASGRARGLTVSGSAAGDYFKALGLDLVQGRDFVAADRRETPAVAILTERLASQLFHGAALGQSLRVSTPFRGAVAADVRIVGIVRSPVGLSGEDVAAVFFPSPFPSPMQPGTSRTLHVHSAGPAAALAPEVRRLVTEVDPRVPILKVGTLDQSIRAEIQTERMLASVAAVLGVVALLLAGAGLYGVTSYSVATRWREIAVRMALGARPERVLAMVVRQALALALIGGIVGGLLGVAAGFIIQSEVFGDTGVDVVTLGGSAALLVAAMLLATLLPARRAARLDPMVVLRDG